MRISLYTAGDMIGRPPTKEAPPFGRRLAAVRKSRGLTQRQLAERMETTREMVDYYERRAVNPAVGVIERAADALGVSVAELMGIEAGKAPPRRGPTGKLRQVFEDAARLPRRQQEMIVEMVSALVKQHDRSPGR